ncbi:MAG: HD domain-containing protein [Lachnospiraceae bacterium]|nr:HD domain-containing protein [Lachnospiraceae bacterium]
MENRAHKLLRYALFYGALVLLNIVLNRIVGALGLPLFIDSVGTLVAAAVGGYLPGITVGYLTNIINMYGAPENAYYAVLNAMMAALCAYLAEKGYFDKFRKTVYTIPLFALIGGALGSVLTYLIYGFGLGEGISAPFAKTLLEKGVFNVFWAQLLSDFAIDIIDKTITVILVYLIIKVLPEQLKKNMVFTFWRQTPMTKEESEEAKKNITKSVSLRSKILIIISIVMIFIAVVTTTISYVLYHDFAVNQYAETAKKELILESANSEDPSQTAINEADAEKQIMSSIKLNEISFITKTVSLFFGFFIMILVLCIWLADYNILFPMNSMTISARHFTYDNEESLENSVERLTNLKITTTDEIESLYDSLSETIAHTVGYMKDVKVKGEDLARIQNGLIYVLADLVESRDQNTGDHVRKTAAYVRMILSKMQEKGMYPDLINDEYIEDVANSAPLHDIGKIKVSDTILNKPGKLTDEEFEKMKMHTIAGNDIINKAMDLVSDTRYLREAKNLATYHHEKWDGSGYPYGLKGEDIPLSARIMAIADVFDALISKRSYKNAFTVDEAMDIVRKGMGTHFDPNIAQVFLESEAEIKRIAEENIKIHEKTS